MNALTIATQAVVVLSIGAIVTSLLSAIANARSARRRADQAARLELLKLRQGGMRIKDINREKVPVEV